MRWTMKPKDIYLQAVRYITVSYTHLLGMARDSGEYSQSAHLARYRRRTNRGKRRSDRSHDLLGSDFPC